jgi:hypothetical protein
LELIAAKWEGMREVPLAGLEPVDISTMPVSDLGKTPLPSAAKSGAVLDDPDLARVVEAWPKLPNWVKAAVLKLVSGQEER